MVSRLRSLLMFIFSASATLPAATFGAEHNSVNGTLVFSGGSELSLIELRQADVASNIIHMAGGNNAPPIISNISKIDDESILVGDSIGKHISMFDMKSGKFTYVVDGMLPLYVSGKMVFYKVIERGRVGLFVSDTRNKSITAIIIDHEFVVDYGPPVRADGDNILFLSRQYGLLRVNKLDVSALATSELPVFDCIPELWRSASRQLMCLDIRVHEHVLVTLDGKTRENIPGWNFVPVMYIEDIDAAMFSYEHGLAHGIGLYSFSGEPKNRTTIVARGPYLGPGTAILFGSARQ